ncbi:hypothetical protein ABIA40_000430 [Bradyrhizobium sp. USDA 223]
MPCLICGHEKTIDAHLIPRAFALEVAPHSGEKHVIGYPGADKFRRTNTGVYDANILCGPCDRKLGAHEGYAVEFLRKARMRLAPPHSYLHAKEVNGDRFVRFAAGLCWKYAVTKQANGRIGTGRYREILADVAFERAPVPSSIDLTAIQLYTGDTEVYFYRAPKADRQQGVNLFRFYIGGFLFFLKTDNRANPEVPPQECWLRGKQSASFAVLPAEMFEEWAIGKQIAGRPNLRSYFDKIRSKPAR